MTNRLPLQVEECTQDTSCYADIASSRCSHTSTLSPHFINSAQSFSNSLFCSVLLHSDEQKEITYRAVVYFENTFFGLVSSVSPSRRTKQTNLSVRISSNSRTK